MAWRSGNERSFKTASPHHVAIETALTPLEAPAGVDGLRDKVDEALSRANPVEAGDVSAMMMNGAAVITPEARSKPGIIR